MNPSSAMCAKCCARAGVRKRSPLVGRSYAESVDIDGKIYFSAERDIMAGEFVNVRLTGTMDGELTGEAVE